MKSAPIGERKVEVWVSVLVAMIAYQRDFGVRDEGIWLC